MVKVENTKSDNPQKVSMKNNKFLYLVMAGFLGTLAFYVAAYVDMAITGVPLDISVVLGQLIAGEHESAYIIGNVAHVANGIGLTLFFGYVFLPISTRIIKGRIWFHGLVFGVMVTVVAVWFGMLPALGAGIAGLNIAPEVPAMTMFRHIVFGLVIGIILRSKMN
ncbi:MAG: hypothetical protein IH792_06590 [Thaumarchaeota archaeon]|nr:hypothetical protein [Nitrososphaerota archaeon]MCH8995564.1 hypothetical protein [Nitrososphaerota archaeon]